VDALTEADLRVGASESFGFFILIQIFFLLGFDWALLHAVTGIIASFGGYCLHSSDLI